MWPIKTKEEWYNDYINAIEELESQIQNTEHNINRSKREIEFKRERIVGLKEMAEIYKPKLP